jgi:SAM-dependent methyltransferase
MAEIILRADHDNWRGIAQEGELAFHKRPGFRSDEARFVSANDRFFRGHGFKPDQFTGKVIVDLGAGSKLRASFFTGAYVIAVEPLADRLRAEVPWCDLDKAAEVYSEPAETLIDALVCRADFLFSVNVLDHCYDFPRCIENIARYIKAGGSGFLAFDCHQKVDRLHPIIINERVATDIIYDAGL